MGGCSAINCKNRSDKYRLFKFPMDKFRRQRWIVNCRRDSWMPGPGAKLCEVHFEESQFETDRVDGWRKLKPNAIPTLFNVPNPPQKISSYNAELEKIQQDVAASLYDCISSDDEGNNSDACAVQNLQKSQDGVNSIQSETISSKSILEQQKSINREFLSELRKQDKDFAVSRVNIIHLKKSCAT